VRAERFVTWTLRHGRLLWLIALLFAIPAAARTAWLYGNLKSDLEELLPPSSPSVVALDELKRRAGGAQYLGVVVDAGSTDRVPEAERFLEALATRIRGYPKSWVSLVRLGRDQERAFLEKNGALYVDRKDLEEARAKITARRDFEVARETGELLDDDAEPPPLDFDDLRAKYDARLPRAKGDSTRFVDPKRHLAVLLVECGSFSTGTRAGKQLIERVQSDVAAVGLPRGMRMGFAGDIAISVEELSALVTDLTIASALVVVAVLGAIVAYYRWWRSILIVFPPLLVAAVLAFGVVSLPPFDVTSLNSNTAFLGSIIVGNGINFGLILLSRYVEERRAGESVKASLVNAVRGARRGTLAAAAAAAVSYASLAVTHFRGFRQFGFIGGFGLMFAWLTAFVLGPPLLTIPAAIAASRLRATDLESDFSKLRRRDTWTSGEGYWGKQMNAVLGEYLSPFVFLTDRPEDARALAAKLRTEIGGPRLGDKIERVRTVDDVLPDQEKAKLAVLADIREVLTPRVRATLTKQQKDFVGRFLDHDLHPLTLEDLPQSFVLGLRERDGSVGRIVLVYPSLDSTWWDANEMRDFVGSLRAIAAEAVPGPRPPRLAGSVPLSSDIVEAVRRDAPLASALSFGGVVCVIFLLIGRRPAALYVTAALVTGVLWLVGASMLLGVRINFANFIAFPITFGIGVDYAVNVVSRYEQDRAAGILGAIRSTGSAVALCSLTTIIGYSSLLLAENRALFLFGVLAVLGEIACLVVALVSLPAFLVLWGRRSEARRRAAVGT
jgi:predicted RND superfamily exporter protein